MKHTPGPWLPACKASGAACRHPAIISDEGQVGTAAWQGSESATDANARLIAAAPDLLEVLQKIVNHVDAGTAAILNRLVSEARAAIAKAEGGKA